MASLAEPEGSPEDGGGEGGPGHGSSSIFLASFFSSSITPRYSGSQAALALLTAVGTRSVDPMAGHFGSVDAAGAGLSREGGGGEVYRRAEGAGIPAT